MASGKLGAAVLSAGVNTLLYTVPDGMVSTLNIRVANDNAVTAKVKVWIGSGAAPVAADIVTPSGRPIVPYGVREDLGIVCAGGEKVWVNSSVANVSVRVHGFEEQV